jgi:hypothetical protein
MAGPELDLRTLPTELRAALERVWPGCPEAQRRALLGPRSRHGWCAIWPDGLWSWQRASRWWRPGVARSDRQRATAFFSAQVSDVLGAKGPRLFDPDQPFFETRWTQSRVLLRSPAPAVFSDADFWALTQQLFGGDVDDASAEALAWAHGMQRDNAVHGARREQWLIDAIYRMEMAATGTFL